MTDNQEAGLLQNADPRAPQEESEGEGGRPPFAKEESYRFGLRETESMEVGPGDLGVDN